MKHAAVVGFIAARFDGANDRNSGTPDSHPTIERTPVMIGMVIAMRVMPVGVDHQDGAAACVTAGRDEGSLRTNVDAGVGMELGMYCQRRPM
jgi:hypothetical protein